MRQKTLLKFCSAAIVLLHLSGVGSSDLSAKTGKYQETAGRGSNSYASAYESGEVKRYRDIMPGRNSRLSYTKYDDKEGKAGTVTNNSVEVRYPDKKKESEDKSKISIYTVKKGDTLFGISRKTGAGVEAISKLNGISGNRIYAGMKLKIETCKKVKKNSEPVNSLRPGRENNDKNYSGVPSFLWPLKNVNDVRRDGNEDVKPIGIFITGVPNSSVVASRDGTVKKIGYMRGYGRYVAISHEGRYVTVYSNLLNIYVKEGVRVHKGGVIGTLSSDRTLHFQIGHAGRPENPLKHLPGRG